MKPVSAHIIATKFMEILGKGNSGIALVGINADGSGITIQESTSLMIEQQFWTSGLRHKLFDFSNSRFWIDPNNIEDPIGIDTPHELLAICEKNNFEIKELEVQLNSLLKDYMSH